MAYDEPPRGSVIPGPQTEVMFDKEDRNELDDLESDLSIFFIVLKAVFKESFRRPKVKFSHIKVSEKSYFVIFTYAIKNI